MKQLQTLMDAPSCDLDYRPIERAELPVETAAMARYLLGKIVVRQTPPRADQRPDRRDRGSSTKLA